MSFEEIIGLLMFLIVFADFIRNWDKDDKQKQPPNFTLERLFIVYRG